jgi:hypothetical protein
MMNLAKIAHHGEGAFLLSSLAAEPSLDHEEQVPHGRPAEEVIGEAFGQLSIGQDEEITRRVKIIGTERFAVQALLQHPPKNGRKLARPAGFGPATPS